MIEKHERDFEDEELDKLFLNWINNVSAGTPSLLDLEKFVSFSIKALEMDNYNVEFIMNSLESCNPHCKYNELIQLTYNNYYYAIKGVYAELKRQGKVINEHEIINEIKKGG